MLLLVEQVDMCTIDMTHAKLVFNGSLSKKAQARTSMSAKVTPFDADRPDLSPLTGRMADSATGDEVTAFGSSMKSLVRERRETLVRCAYLLLCIKTFS
jgi:hypothetical protein